MLAILIRPNYRGRALNFFRCLPSTIYAFLDEYCYITSETSVHSFVAKRHRAIENVSKTK